MLNYSEKSVGFPSTLLIDLVKTMCLNLNSIVIYCCRTENQGYILLLASEVELDQALGKIPIVKECPNVFLRTYWNFPQNGKLSSI